MKKRFITQSGLRRTGHGLAASLLLAAALPLLGATPVHAAYNENPFGFVDSCTTTTDGYTVLYGWVHDANALSGNFPQAYIEVTNYGYFTVDTGLAGYRDAQINDWINTVYPGTPTGNTYGFVAYLSGLVRGNTYTVSGLAVNYGPGGNTPLYINTSGNVDGDPAKPYFPGQVIPQACIYTPPPPTPAPTPGPTAAPTPVPTKVPTPAPTTPPSGGTGNTPTGNGSGSTSKPAVVSKPGASNNTTPTSGATVVTPQSQTSVAPEPISEGNNLWTALVPYATSVDVTVFAKDAQRAELYFGQNEQTLAKIGEESLTTNRAEFTVNYLSPMSSYYYKVVSHNNDGSKTEGKARLLNTKGFRLSLTFKNTGGQDVQGVTAKINNRGGATQSTAAATIVFEDVMPGEYTVDYIYQQKQYSTKITFKSNEASQDDVASKTITIPASGAGSVKSSKVRYIVIGGFAALMAAGLGASYLLRHRYFGAPKKRRRRSAEPAYTTTQPSESQAQPMPTDQADNGTQIDPMPGEAVPGAPHRGQSLKDMVLESMAQEAANKNRQP